MRVKVLGQYLRLLFPPHLGTDYGHCEPPGTPNRAMRVAGGLRGVECTSTVLHEALHAAGWHIDEPFVDQWCDDVAKILHTPAVWKRISDT